VFLFEGIQVVLQADYSCCRFTNPICESSFDISPAWKNALPFTLSLSQSPEILDDES